MLIPTRKSLFYSVLCAALLSLLAAPTIFTASASIHSAPLAPGHNINFQAVGLPDGVLFTITGTRVNNGGHPTTYSISFTTPDLSASIGVDPGSEFTYNDFPSPLMVGTQYYELVSALPASPFTTGESGGLTTVVATYQAACFPPGITADPSDQAVQYGDPVTFNVTSTGSPVLTYEWYKDGNLVQGADQSAYTIPSVSMSDTGMYYAVVTNSCGTATSSSAQLSVNKANQFITFDQPASPAVFGTNFVVAPFAGSGLPVDLAVSGVCSLAGSEVTMTSGTGTCTITASQGGDDNYNPAPDVTHDVEAAKANQAIAFTPPASPATYGTSFSLVASANSGLTVSFEVAGVCSLAGSEVTMTSGTGTCTITASQGGDVNYKSAEVVTSIVQATKASQSIIFTNPSSPVKYQTSFTVSPTSSSGLTVTLTSSGSCSNSGYTVTITKTSGSCVLTASQAGNMNYLPAGIVQRSVMPAPNGNVLYIPLVFGH